MGDVIVGALKLLVALFSSLSWSSSTLMLLSTLVEIATSTAAAEQVSASRRRNHSSSQCKTTVNLLRVGFVRQGKFSQEEIGNVTQPALASLDTLAFSVF